MVLTVVSVVYNVATRDRVKPASAFYGGPFVRVDGKLVAYRRWGAQGTPVIVLGGFIVPSSVWDGVGRRLARDHRVFAIDLPPFGYTERKGPYTLRGWAELVRAFERRFDLRRPAPRRPLARCGGCRGRCAPVSKRDERDRAARRRRNFGRRRSILGEQSARWPLGYERVPNWNELRLDLPARSCRRLSEPSSIHAPLPGRVGAAVQGAGNPRRVSFDVEVWDPGLPPSATSGRASPCAGALGSA